MNRNIATSLAFSLILLGSASFVQEACANNMPYEPIFESAPITESITSANTGSTAQKSSITKVAPAASAEKHAVNLTPVGDSDNLQNALIQLDTAQVEIRNQLIQYKSEYTDIDNQYKLVKEQRKLKNQQVKATEKRIKNLDNTKEKIRKSM